MLSPVGVHSTSINTAYLSARLLLRLLVISICKVTVNNEFPYLQGGGWTLAVSISSKNNDHLQRNANNCLNSILCVPFAENNIIGRKLSDDDVYKLAQTEGKLTYVHGYTLHVRDGNISTTAKQLTAKSSPL